MHNRIWMMLILLGSFAATTACQRPARTASPEDAGIRQDAAERRSEAGDVSSNLTRAVADDGPIRILVDTLDPERWLVVEAVRNGSPGGWASGAFDPERNKLSIRTRDVERFAIDTGRVAIDWDRLVVLGIDGRNSELRRRDFTVYHFALDEHGRWVVLEP